MTASPKTRSSAPRTAAASAPAPGGAEERLAASASPVAGAASTPTPGSRSGGAEALRGPGSSPRTWTLELPEGTTIISANNRLDRWTKNRLTKDLHAKVADAVKRQMPRPLPVIGLADITVKYVSPPRLRRLRHPLASDCISDSENIAPTGKALIDGLVKEAHLWPSDSKKYVRKVTYILAKETHPRGLIRIHITEVTG